MPYFSILSVAALAAGVRGHALFAADDGDALIIHMHG
jgi:hypothetical protein